MANDKIELHGWTDLIIEAQALIDLTSPAYKLYSYYILRARDKGSAFPGLPRTAYDMTIEEGPHNESWSESKVKRYNTELTDKHYIVRQRRMSTSSITHVFKTPELCLKFLSQVTGELSDQVTGEPTNSSPATRITGHPRPDIKRTKFKKNEVEDSAGKPAAPKSTAPLDANGIAINNKHPQWEAFWNAVLAVKGLVQAKMTQQELANVAKVVREIIKPCAFEASDVMAFPAFIREKEWGDWTINVIPTRISEVRQWRLQKNQSTDQPVITRPSESAPISDDVRKENRARVEAFERQRAEEAKRRGTDGDDNE